jgi:D-glycero-D-manno-heptose 1,7-bisphosphate phosphatase
MKRKLKKKHKPAVFLDRDGTLISDVGYLSHPSQVRFFPKAAEALKLLRKKGFYLFVVTNQSGVARGYFQVSDVHRAHRRIQSLLRAKGARLDGFFYCPHYPRGKVKSFRRVCGCRKPQPGMVLQAARRFGVDLSRSYAVGDKRDDLLLAENAGLRRGLLARTGNGKRTEKEMTARERRKFPVVSNLYQAARWILKDSKKIHFHHGDTEGTEKEF